MARSGDANAWDLVACPICGMESEQGWVYSDESVRWVWAGTPTSKPTVDTVLGRHVKTYMHPGKARARRCQSCNLAWFAYKRGLDTVPEEASTLVEPLDTDSGVLQPVCSRCSDPTLRGVLASQKHIVWTRRRVVNPGYAPKLAHSPYSIGARADAQRCIGCKLVWFTY